MALLWGLFVLGTTAAIGAGAAGQLLDSSLAARSVNLIARQEYDAALEWCDSLLQTYPELPDGYFIRATILYSRGIDFEDEVDAPAAAAANDSVQAICSRSLNAGAAAPWLYYYRGTVLGYESYEHFRQGRYLKGYLVGVEAARDFRAALALDSTYYDACLGLGTFLYYRSAYAGFLREMGIFGDHRAEGRALIARSAAGGSFSRLPAESALAWIDIDEQRYDSAAVRARDLLERYPGNRSFRWCLGRALIGLERWSDAAPVYGELLASLRAEPRNNYFNEIGCLHALARCYVNLQDWESALKVSGEALALSPAPDIAQRKADDLKRLRQSKAQALKQTKSR